MPTLLNVPVDQVELTHQANAEMEDDDSVTELPEDSFAFQRRRGIGRVVVEGSSIPDGSPDAGDGPQPRQYDKSVAFDDSIAIFSAGKPHGTENGRRGIDLDSDVSLLDDVGIGDNADTQSPFKTVLSPVHYHMPKTEPAREIALKQELSWPHRDKYLTEYQQFVKQSISTFQTTYPGLLRDYRTMSVEEKAQENERVRLLLNRLGISKKLVPSDAGSQTRMSSNTVAMSKAEPPTDIDRRRQLLDESISPYVPSHARRRENDSELGNLSSSEHPSNDSCRVGDDKSELLLSIEHGVDCGAEFTSRMKNYKTVTAGGAHTHDMNDSLCFPVKDSPVDSVKSMEVVRREAPSTDDERSYETPEDQIGVKPNGKRSATSSGRRGEALHRTRHNEDVAQSTFKLRGEEVDLASRLGKLSISPPPTSPPRDPFIELQSPINPRLPYSMPSHEDDDNDSFGVADGGDQRVSWGGSSTGNKMDVSADSLASYTPSKSYKNLKDKLRAFREVPANVTLKEGAVFHVGKLEVKRAERSKTTIPMERTRETKSKPDLQRQRYRHVNFPDPFVRYNNRHRLALNEIFTWINKAECMYDDGESNEMAAGAFFSLSDDQIMAIGIKLLLHDASRGTRSKSRDSSSFMRGGTIVIVRSKEDTAAWESALREGTGCSVLNHATLPLSERIRISTSERACMYDVLLSTYDAMKSPDNAIPVDEDGRAIVRKTSDHGGWHASRSTPECELEVPSRTKQLSVLHRVQFKRIIFVDALGRKCFLAKGNTARASAAVALNGESRLVFFGQIDGGGSSALRALRKSDKGAFRSVSAVLHLADGQSDDVDDGDDDDDSAAYESPLESVAVDYTDLLC